MGESKYWAVAAIVLWFVLFIAGSIVVLVMFLSRYFSTDDLAKNSWGWYLADFDQRLEQYKTTTATKVLIGPCYAYDLGEFGDFFNLGLPGIRPSEMAKIASQCRPDHTVYVFTTLRDAKLADKPARLSVVNPVCRKMAIIRDHIRLKLGFYKKEHKSRGWWQVRNAKIMASIKYPEKAYDALWRIVSAHPNVKFVISPMKPNMPLGIEDLRQRFIISAKQFDPIDLSDLLEGHMFPSFSHINKHGLAMIREELVNES